ncbi:MAG: zinc-ribbon domain-containing protein, partial [Promethearchaeota archaeon]
GHNITLPISIQVGNVQTTAKPISIASVTKSETPAVKVNCPYCGDEIDKDAKFCPHCGSNIAEKTQDIKDTKNCQNCGNELPIEAKFCASCGQAV